MGLQVNLFGASLPPVNRLTHVAAPEVAPTCKRGSRWATRSGWPSGSHTIQGRKPDGAKNPGLVRNLVERLST